MHFEKRWMAVCGAGLAVAGCSTTPEQVDAQFGNAERNMIAVQHFEPAVRGRPYNGEGVGALKAERAYRTDAGLKSVDPTPPPVSIIINDTSKVDR